MVLACVGAHNETSRSFLEDVVCFPRVGILHADCDLFRWMLVQTDDTLHALSQRLKAFSNRSYWSRLWILQELYGGRPDLPCCPWTRVVILCGNSILAYSQLSNYVLNLNSLGSYANWVEGKHRIVLPRCDWRRASFCGNATLSVVRAIENLPDRFAGNLGWLEKLTSFQCEDMRNKIYGVLSLIDGSRTSPPPLSPDYTISNLELAMRCLDHVSSLYRGLDEPAFTPSIDDIKTIVAYLSIGIEEVHQSARMHRNGQLGRQQLSSAAMIRVRWEGCTPYKLHADAQGSLYICAVAVEPELFSHDSCDAEASFNKAIGLDAEAFPYKAFVPNSIHHDSEVQDTCELSVKDHDQAGHVVVALLTPLPKSATP